MKNAPSRAVVCYSKNEIYARLAWLLQPARYSEFGPVALIAIQTDEKPWTSESGAADSESITPATGDPFEEEAVALQAAGQDAVVTLLDYALRSMGEDRDLICSLSKNVYGILRAPITRPAEPEAFAHSLLADLTGRTSIALWASVAVSVLGDTPGLLINHSLHALAQAEQLGAGQLAIFDEVDRSVVQMQLAEEQALQAEQEANAQSPSSDQPEAAPKEDSSGDEEFEPLVSGSNRHSNKGDKQIRT